MKYVPLYVLSLLFVFYTSCKGQNKTDLPNDNTKSEADITSRKFSSVTRTIKQDRKGNIWIATFAGVFRYDGKAFTNIMSKVSSARFFSLLVDRKDNLWFGSIGSGVYQYDGKSFQHFTSKEGLANNEITCIYEDKKGNVWFGANGGVSRYDGKVFRNYMIKGDSIVEDRIGIPSPDFIRPPKEINSIVEDKKGRFWISTRGNTFIYDGKTFAVFRNNDGKPFTNVRSIIEDKKGNIWLGGQDGLWRYDGRTCTNFTQSFVGYILEDKKGNIWTSSESANGSNWVLSRYEEKSLSNKKPTVTELKPELGMLFGLLEATDGSIWFGAGGVYRYDGKTITDFKK